jgi:hypothetical protein
MASSERTLSHGGYMPELRTLIGKAERSLFEDSFEPSDGFK